MGRTSLANQRGKKLRGRDGLGNAWAEIRVTGGALELVNRVLIPGYDQHNAPDEEVRALARTMEEAGTDERTCRPQDLECLDQGLLRGSVQRLGPRAGHSHGSH
jgi:hypothetical protein